MRVVEISEPGGPEVLRPATRRVPQPAAGEILIRVRAAGVNRPDVQQRRGAYDPPPGASDLPGLEAAGEVAAVGPGGSPWRVGDPVCALLPGGGYAEYALTHQSHALPVPRGLGMAEAAALCETFFTVWANVFLRGRLEAGESFLVHGGSSGIGTTAIQLARARGARVFTTVGSEAKARACRDLGAELAITYRDTDFVAAVREATQGRGVDLVLDMVGGDYLARDVRALAPDGRLVMIAQQAGPKAELNGSTLRPQSVEAKARIAADLRREVWPLIEAGRIAPVMDARFPLEAAAEAHARLESSAHIGKIVLEVA
jgi:putative PIG3 family NAD(P)H quinone oxidoreductase